MDESFFSVLLFHPSYTWPFMCNQRLLLHILQHVNQYIKKKIKIKNKKSSTQLYYLQYLFLQHASTTNRHLQANILCKTHNSVIYNCITVKEFTSITIYEIHVTVSYMLVEILINKTVIKYPWYLCCSNAIDCKQYENLDCV